MNATFSPLRWAQRFATATEARHANALTTSGYSAGIEERSAAELLRLYGELFGMLLAVELTADDLFTRPHLAAVVTAVHAARSAARAESKSDHGLDDAEAELLCLALLGLGDPKKLPTIADQIVALATKLGVLPRITAKASTWLKFAVKQKREGGAA